MRAQPLLLALVDLVEEQCEHCGGECALLLDLCHQPVVRLLLVVEELLLQPQLIVNFLDRCHALPVRLAVVLL